MSAFSEFFLMKPDDVKRYAVEVLHRFDPDEETDCTEIGDGNMNFIYRVKRGEESVIFKQAGDMARRAIRHRSENRQLAVPRQCCKKQGRLVFCPESTRQRTFICR